MHKKVHCKKLKAQNFAHFCPGSKPEKGPPCRNKNKKNWLAAAAAVHNGPSWNPKSGSMTEIYQRTATDRCVSSSCASHVNIAHTQSIAVGQNIEI